MKDFRAALSTLPLTQPIFKIRQDGYDGSLLAEPVNGKTWLVEDTDSVDVKLAKKFGRQEYDPGECTYKIQYGSSLRALEEEIVFYLLRFIKAHSPQKHPKNTKLYKFTEKIVRIMQEEAAAAEAYYSTYKYLWSNNAVNEQSTNIHVQNGLKILETLRNRFEKKPK
jgi:hypothetical protein